MFLTDPDPDKLTWLSVLILDLSYQEEIPYYHQTVTVPWYCHCSALLAPQPCFRLSQQCHWTYQPCCLLSAIGSLSQVLLIWDTRRLTLWAAIELVFHFSLFLPLMSNVATCLCLSEKFGFSVGEKVFQTFINETVRNAEEKPLISATVYFLSSEWQPLQEDRLLV